MKSEITKFGKPHFNRYQPKLMSTENTAGEVVIALVTSKLEDRGIVVYSDNKLWEIGEPTGLHGYEDFHGSIELTY